jgi:hypothetical protein
MELATGRGNGPGQIQNRRPAQIGVGARLQDRLGGFAHLGSRHHFHRFRDLLGAADRFDSALYISALCHNQLKIYN